MKKTSLLIVVLFCSLGINAQHSNRDYAKPFAGTNLHSIPLSMASRGITKKVRIGKSRAQMNNNFSHRLTDPNWTQSALWAFEHIIGTTTYDLQTSGTISNRLVNNSDGTISAVWTRSNQAIPWIDRGTGYNYFNGTSWGFVPTGRIESFRTGFTNVAVGASGGEKILANTATALHGLAHTSRPVKGTGSWLTIPLPGTDSSDMWPKLVAGGANGQSFHAIWQGSGTSLGPILYSGSTDNGATWSTPVIPPGLDTNYYRGYGSDSYSIDASDDVVAIVAGDIAMDLVLLKSTDNGVSWTKTIIDSFPIPFYNSATMNTDTNSDGIADTLFTNASDATVVLDTNHVAHVFFGGTRIWEPPGGTGFYSFRTFDLFYWNENMAPGASVLIATPPDLNHDSVITLPTGCNFVSYESPFAYYGTGIYALIEMPSAGVDDRNNIYCCYQAVDELSDTSLYGQCFMHPYLIRSLDGGANWTNPDDAIDVVMATQPVAGQGYDGVYAAMAKRVDTKTHIIYQRDFAPGISLGSNLSCEAGNNYGVNDIVYVNIDTMWNPFWGIQEYSAGTTLFSVTANYPNPFNDKTSFDINLVKASDVSVEVSNLLGEVLTINKYSNMHSGFHTLTLDGNHLSDGIYFYKVKVGEEAVTQKMVVQ